MPSAVSVRTDFSAGELRRLAATTKNANQSRRLLSMAAVLDGMNRTEAARIGGMDRQTLRDWVHRFNEHGPDGLKDTWSKGNPPRLSPEQQAELAQARRDRPRSGRAWRRALAPRSTCSASSPSASASSITSARSARSSSSSASPTSAPARATRRRMGRPSRRSKKLSRDAEGASGRRRQGQAGRDLVPGRGPHRPEERHRPAMGETRFAAAPARRPALRERLSLRRDLPGARHGRRAGACPTPIPRPCSSTSTRSPAPSPEERHAVLLLDRAGWHTTGNLVIPKNITLVFLPSRAPELNPVENVWQYLRHNWLSNRVFDTYEAIVEAACDAWRKLLAQPDTITSIGHARLGSRRSKMTAVGITLPLTRPWHRSRSTPEESAAAPPGEDQS